MARQSLEPLPFEIEARVPLQLGRESISNSIVAIMEVIKNAYDADATIVKIEFQKVDSENEVTKLIISDNGHGMDLDELKNSWLKIGSRNKTKKHRSKKLNRVFTGAKGLGRLGLDRLAPSLVLYTKKKNMSHSIELNVDWTNFERPNTTLSAIKNKTYKIDVPSEIEIASSNFNEKSKSGTVLILPDLRDSWDREYFERLRRQLSYLVSPFASAIDFSISVKYGDKIAETITAENYLDEALVTVTAELKEINENYFVDMNVFDREGRKMESLQKTCWTDFVSLDNKREPFCGPLSIQLYYYTLKKGDFFDSVPSLTARDYLRKNFGIRIYRDNVRVLPYGEPTGSGDWLNLGTRAQSSPGGMAQGGWRVNNYQLMGAVDIARDSNPMLVDQTNREGLQENKALHDMERFVLSVVEKFELAMVTHARTIKKKPRNTSSDSVTTQLEHSHKNLGKATENLSTQLDDLQGKEVTENDIRKIKSNIERIENAVKSTTTASAASQKYFAETTRELQIQKDTLTNLASIGILAIAFGHETMQDANTIVMSASDLVRSYKNNELVLSEKHADHLNNLMEKAKFLNGLSSFYLSSIVVSKRKRKDVSPYKVASRVVHALQPALMRQNIQIDLISNGNETHKVTSFEIDFESLFVNLITNSIYALGRVKRQPRRILIEFRKNKSSLLIHFSDSGSGISKVNIKSVFQPMFSTRKSARGQQIGTGMGLYICKNVVEQHMNGDISIEGKGALGGATILVRVPISTRGRK